MAAAIGREMAGCPSRSWQFAWTHIPRFIRAQQFTIGQLAIMIAGIAGIFALLRMGEWIALLVVSAGLYLLKRIRDPHGSSVPTGCLGALLGLAGGAVWAAIVIRNSVGRLPIAGVSLGCAIVGGVVGQVIGFALSLGRPRPANAPKRKIAPDAIDPERKRLLDEYETVQQLILQLENDGDHEVLTKLAAHRAKLKGALGLQ